MTCCPAEAGPIDATLVLTWDHALSGSRDGPLCEDIIMEMIRHWIDGAHVEGTSRRTSDVVNPATGAITGRVVLADREDARTAVHAARRAFTSWSQTTLARRSSVLFAFRELLTAHRDVIAEILTREHGKTFPDAQGEVQRGLEVVEFACGIPHLMKGANSTSVSTGIDTSSRRQPLGVSVIISPFNFPAMVPLWFFPIAIATGNTVVLKPSEKDPSASNCIAELWQKAGLPDGVFNVLHGDQETVEALLDDPDVASVSFVGSTPVAKAVYTRTSANGKRVQALGGAKNHMLVMPDADLDVAADAAASAAYGAAGERCMAISVAVVLEDVGDTFVDNVTQRAQALVTGDGMDPGSQMGPLITAAHRDRVASLIQTGTEEGAKLMVDGRDLTVPDREGGYWIGPTVFDHVQPAMAIYQEEIFGPVLCIVRVPTYAAALEVINGNRFGNGTVIFTNDGAVARRFESDVEVGMVGVNVPIPVPSAFYPFGGWKDSLFGDTHAYGTDGIHFFTRNKVVTSRWLDPEARAEGMQLGFPIHE